MANSEITRLQKDAADNEALQKALVETGNDLDKVVAVANQHGYKFTKADLEAAIAEGSSKGAVSSEQLDKVAGGLVVSVVAGVIA